MTEQKLIDLLVFLLYNVGQPILYVTFLSFMLTPKYNRLLIILGCALWNTIFYLPNYIPSVLQIPVLQFVNFFLIFAIPTLFLYKEKKLICLLTCTVFNTAMLLSDLFVTIVLFKYIGFHPVNVTPHNWKSVTFSIFLDILFAVIFLPIVVLWNKFVKKKTIGDMKLFVLFPISQMIFFCRKLVSVVGEKDFRLFGKSVFDFCGFVLGRRRHCNV